MEGYRRRWKPNKGDLWTFVRTRVQEAVRQEIREASAYVPTEMDEFEAPQVRTSRLALMRAADSRVPTRFPLHASGNAWTVRIAGTARGVSERYVPESFIAEGKLFARKTAAGYEIPEVMALEFLARPKS